MGKRLPIAESIKAMQAAKSGERIQLLLEPAISALPIQEGELSSPDFLAAWKESRTAAKPPGPPLGPVSGQVVAGGADFFNYTDTSAWVDTMEEAFNRFDTNNDGMLDKWEVTAMIEAVGYQGQGENLAHDTLAIFGRYDLDQNGTISMEEFPALWKYIGGRDATVREMFSRYDTNNDGFLDETEVNALIESTEYHVTPSELRGAMSLFARMDANGDGKIDISEFPALWKHIGFAPLAMIADTSSTAPKFWSSPAGIGPFTTSEAPTSSLNLPAGPPSAGPPPAGPPPAGPPRAAPVRQPGGTWVDTLEEAFNRFDVLGEGVLDQPKVAALIESLGHPGRGNELAADAIHNFGQNGVIGLDDFPVLWAHYGGSRFATVSDMFHRYDTNKDGHLDAQEVKALVESVGYQVDRDQLMDAMSLFKQFDTDHDGAIKVGEFPALWQYLGFRPLAADSGPPPTVALSFAKSRGFLAGKSVDNSYPGPNSPRNSSRSAAPLPPGF
jgi:Ca2+-binding EF-hand superfamily protein